MLTPSQQDVALVEHVVLKKAFGPFVGAGER